MLPPAEKGRQVAFKKEMAEEKARYHAAYEALEAVWKKEEVELWGRARHRAEEVYTYGYFMRKVKAASASSLRGGRPMSSSVPPIRSSYGHPTKWQDLSRSSARKMQVVVDTLVIHLERDLELQVGYFIGDHQLDDATAMFLYCAQVDNWAKEAVEPSDQCFGIEWAADKVYDATHVNIVAGIRCMYDADDL
ncbi:Glutamine synthetase [Hordeum vulgare]|nr:Glutamine synthetase [Hordeum vulgare]